MCGIAGIVDLAGAKPPVEHLVKRMADAILHRGPDEDGYFFHNGMGLANRRLSIVGLKDGRQPITNEDGSITVVFNGEFFDYPNQRARLEAQGHTFRTSTDTELLPHMWEQYGENMFEHLKGQFAICLYDSRQNQLILARDRMGICPLFWTVQKPTDGPYAGSNLFLFGSEIRALHASGLVPRKVNMMGLNHIFSFFALPGPLTCFEGIQMITPGRYLKIQLGAGMSPETAIQRKTYWEIDFPNEGDEIDLPEKQMVDEYESLLLGAVNRRLFADVPVVSYLSGGVDSSTIVALASKVLGRPIPTFTISVQSKGLNEETEAAQTARHVGSKMTVVNYGHSDVRENYPEFIEAAEMPVIDTSSAALMILARKVRDSGYKVCLTGEGADETLAGYSWFKIHRILSSMNIFNLPIDIWLRQTAMKLSGQPRFSKQAIAAAHDIVGGHNGFIDVYGLMSMSKLRFYNADLKAKFADYPAYGDIEIPSERLKKWHPFNRGMYLGQRIMLPGHLLCAKGDRIAMHSSVETRYPFLDEAMIDFTAKIHPRWKLRGLREKYLLRKVAERWLPKEAAWRRKVMFRAPMDSFHLSGPDVPKWIDQVLSVESLKKTGIFDIEAVQYWRERVPKMARMLKRTGVEMGLVAVTATQLWHHLFISGNLADIPSRVGTDAA